MVALMTEIQTEKIKELQRLLDFFERKVDYLEEIYDHYDPEEGE